MAECGYSVVGSIGRIAGKLFACVLGAAAIGKVLAPARAVSMFEALGVDAAIAEAFVYGVAGAEWLAAAFLVAADRHAVWPRVGAWVVGVIAVARVTLSYGLDVRECGCFGGLDVPEWAHLGAVLVGAAGFGACCIASRHAVRCVACAGVRDHAASAHSGRILAAVAVYAMLVFVRVFALVDDSETAAREFCEGVGIPGRFVLVSSGCADCRVWLEKNAGPIPPRESGGESAACLVFSESDRNRNLVMARYPHVGSMVVSEETWWAIVRESPPVVIRCRTDDAVEIVRE